MNLVTKVAKGFDDQEGVPVNVFSLQHSIDNFLGRILMSETEMNPRDLYHKELNENELRNLQRATQSLKKLEICVEGGPLHIKKLCQVAEGMSCHPPDVPELGLLVIDGLDEICVGRGYTASERRIEKVLKKLKKLAVNLKIPVVLTLSLEAKNKTTYGLNQYKKCRVLEQFADTFIVLERERADFIDPGLQEDGINAPTDVIIYKNESGGTGITTLDYFPEKQQFVDSNPQEF